MRSRARFSLWKLSTSGEVADVIKLSICPSTSAYLSTLLLFPTTSPHVLYYSCVDFHLRQVGRQAGVSRRCQLPAHVYIAIPGSLRSSRVQLLLINRVLVPEITHCARPKRFGSVCVLALHHFRFSKPTFPIHRNIFHGRGRH